MPDRRVDVIVDLAGEQVLAGRMWSHRAGRRETATFVYANDYLSHRHAYQLDPALELMSGHHAVPDGQAMFGAFTDCAPDRWGRTLVARAESRRARAEGTAGRSLGEIDYLLGVRDDMRQGALRFRDTDSSLYLAEIDGGVPTLVELPRLLAAAERLDGEHETEQDLADLLRGGSSLGGARPKAHVELEPERFAIAKFPSPSRDRWDVISWEAVALALARDAGIRVPDHQLHRIDGKPVLVSERFDRSGSKRLGYVSAMTMLEARDGDTRSYPEIAETFDERSSQATEDRRQLWRRVAFSILVSNTDDHLRNHGFVRRSTSGWSLAPAFDLNPDPSPGRKHLSTAIDLEDTEARIDTLLEVAELFDLRRDEAEAMLAEVSRSTSRWRVVATQMGLGGPAIEDMAPAFEHEQAERARSLG